MPSVNHHGAVLHKWLSDQCRKTKGSLFKVPKGKLVEWQAIIPKKGMKDSSTICWRHFNDDDLIKGGLYDNVFIPRNDYWHLRRGAVPRHHLGIKHYFDNWK